MGRVLAIASVVLVTGILGGCGEDDKDPNVGKSCTTVGKEGGECGSGLGCFAISGSYSCRKCGSKSIGVACGDSSAYADGSGECVCGSTCLRPSGEAFRCMQVCDSSADCSMAGENCEAVNGETYSVCN